MPSIVVPYILCGKQGRLARSKYTKICTIAREEKIREGYRCRRGIELNSPALNQQVYVSCHKSLVFQLKSVSTINKTGPSRRMKNCSSQISNYNSGLIDITNSKSITPLCESHCGTTAKEPFNTSYILENQQHDPNNTTPIEICFHDNKEVSPANALAIVICTCFIVCF